jgi:hypothetical protein
LLWVAVVGTLEFFLRATRKGATGLTVVAAVGPTVLVSNLLPVGVVLLVEMLLTLLRLAVVLVPALSVGMF